MTFAGKIRTYLVIAALFPPFLMMLVIYFSTVKQIDETDSRNASAGLEQFAGYYDATRINMAENLKVLSLTENIRKAIVLTKKGSARRVNIENISSSFDFVEILDVDLTVLASTHRPGLLGNKIHEEMQYNYIDKATFFETVEYDRYGAHPSLACLMPLDSNIFLFAGSFLDSRFGTMLGSVISAEIDIILSDSLLTYSMPIQHSDRLRLYENNDIYYAILMGGEKSGYYLIARFLNSSDKHLLMNLLEITGIVALLATLIALLLGIYISGRAKKEINNLINATSRVARGDFDTTVMAYEEGEFAQLADSFSSMVTDLKALQKQLTTSEKIAAWKIVGQKVAHEIKNPLTPISISIDDLQSSYNEKLPDFDKTLRQTTSTIKTELERLTKLLDQFVSFARMNPSKLVPVKLKMLINEINSLYQKEIESGRITVDNMTDLSQINIDPDAIKQVIINLIKNGLESSDGPNISLVFEMEKRDLIIRIEDDGPGFSSNILENSFTPYITTKKDGSGLGLAICQRVIYDHRGTIELYNLKEGGAGILIKIPVGDGENSNN